MSEVDRIKSEVWIVNNHDNKMEFTVGCTTLWIWMLKSLQVKLRQTEDHLKHQSQQLSSCRRLIDQHEERLEEASKDLRRSKCQNTDLRSTVDRMGTQVEPGQMRYGSSRFICHVSF